MRYFGLLIFALLSTVSYGQVSVFAGGSMLAGFGNFSTTLESRSPWGGFHLGFEVPRDDAVSIYGKYSHYFGQKANDLSVDSTFIFVKNANGEPDYNFLATKVDADVSMNYHIIEGGTRYYLGNGFDFGFAAYGGTNFSLIFNQVKEKVEDFDTDLYTLDNSLSWEGSILSIGFGLSGGVKYSFPRLGTFYFDANASYIIFAQPNRQNMYVDLYAPLLFQFNLGYRKDLIW